MYFIFSSWYIVIGILAVLAIAMIVGFILMDRKDREIIQEFLLTAEQTTPAPVTADSTASVHETDASKE